MTKGWFIGDFEPSAIRTDKFEVACKIYSAGSYEPKHVHKIATELTLVVDGHVKMNDLDFVKGDIVQIDPGEETDFLAMADTVTVVVKFPSLIGDKYIIK